MFERIRAWWHVEGYRANMYERASQAGRFQVLVETAIRDMSEGLAYLETGAAPEVISAVSVLEDSRNYLAERLADILGTDPDPDDEHESDADRWGKHV